MMIQTKLIIYIKEEKTFKITEYGIHALKLYGEMDKLLVSATDWRGIIMRFKIVSTNLENINRKFVALNISMLVHWKTDY